MREYLKKYGIGILLIFIVSYLGLWNGSAALKLTLGYLIVAYLPASLYFIRKPIPFAEKFVLTNVLGLSLSTALVALDVVFRVPLVTLTYISVSVIFLLCGLWVAHADNKRQL